MCMCVCMGKLEDKANEEGESSVPSLELSEAIHEKPRFKYLQKTDALKPSSFKQSTWDLR